MKDFSNTFSYMLPGTTRVLFYSPLVITKVYPNNGDYSGGTEIYLEGLNFDLSYGGLWCRFDGTHKVQAHLIEHNHLLSCVSPPAYTPPTLEDLSKSVLLEVSLDGVNFFSGNGNLYFTYLVPPKFLSVTPLRQSIWGQQNIIIAGTDFPS